MRFQLLREHNRLPPVKLTVPCYPALYFPTDAHNVRKRSY